MLRQMFAKTPEKRNDCSQTHKKIISPNSMNNSVDYMGDYNSNSFKNNTTMADSFSRIGNLKQLSTKNLTFGKSLKSLNSADRINSSRGFEDSSGRRLISNMNNTGQQFYTTNNNLGKTKKSLSNSVNFSVNVKNSSNKSVKGNKILNNLQGFVHTSPSIKTVLVRRPILPKQKTNFTQRNISETRNKLHIRDRYPYNEFKIDRDPKNNLENGTY